MTFTASSVVRELIAAGVTGDALVTALERIEASSMPVKSKGAERTARWREKKEQRHGDVTVTHCDDKKVFDKERVSHTLPKEITIQENNILPGAMADLVADVVGQIETLTDPLPDDATACHDAVEAVLAEVFDVQREATVQNFDGVSGRYDLVVSRGNDRVAIEIDRRQARAKSVQKLLGFNGGRIQVLRGPVPAHGIAGIDAFVSLPIDFSGKPKARKDREPMPDDFEPDSGNWNLADSLGFSERETMDQVQRMRDWAVNADSSKALKRDWQAAFRNWIKKAADDKSKRPTQHVKATGNSRAQNQDILDAIVREAERREAEAGVGGIQDGNARAA